MIKKLKKKVLSPKWLVMLDNYPFCFIEFKKDIKQYNLDSEEKENLEYIKIKLGSID